MTVYLAEQAAEDSEELVVAWMTPLRRSAIVRTQDDPLPFTLVTQIGGDENVDEGTAEPMVSVHTLCDKSLGWSAAKEECRQTHKRMLRLAVHCDVITLSDGRKVGVDFVEVTESPIWVPYTESATTRLLGDENIVRKVGRYKIGLSYVPT